MGLNGRHLPAREPVSLEQAFGWWCPHCRQRNYVDAVPVEFENDEERRAAYIECGMIDVFEDTPPPECGQFLMAPDTVQCSRCRTKYPAQDADDETRVELGGGDEDED